MVNWQLKKSFQSSDYMYYIRTTGNQIDCTCDLFIRDGYRLVVASLVDAAIKNKKVCADVVKGVGIKLYSYDSKGHHPIYSHGKRYRYRSTKLGNLSHAIIQEHNHGYAINWKGENNYTFLSKFIQHNLSIPITPEIVKKIIGYRGIQSLDIHTTNPMFKGLQGWSLDKSNIISQIATLDLDLIESQFDWDTIKTSEDYLVKFIEPIAEKLEKSVSVLYDPDSVDQSIFEGKKRPLEGQIRPNQACIEVLKRRKYVYLNATQGFGKEQPLYSKILTPDGWVTMGDAYKGMPVIGRDGKTHSVTNVFPQGEKDVYRLTFRDGTKVDCGLEHLWAVKEPYDRLNRKGWKIMSLKDILEKPLFKSHGGRRFNVPLCDPIQYSKKQLPLDPYTLGAFLGDGSLGIRPSLHLPLEKQEILDNIKLPEDISSKVDQVEDNYSSCRRITFPKKKDYKSATNPLIELFKSMNLRVHGKFKFIPNEYKLGSIEQRLAILRGLMDTDGSISKNRVAFHTSTKQLAEDLAEIVRSLGGVSVIRTYDRSDEGKSIEYSVNVKLTVCPFLMKTKANKWSPANHNQRPCKFIDKIEKLGKTEQQCISVSSPDNLYITDNFIVTHNTVCAPKINHASQHGNYVSLIVAPTTTLKTWQTEIKDSIGDEVDVIIIKKTTEFIKLYNRGFEFDKPTYFLIGKETLKLDSQRKPAAIFKDFQIGRRKGKATLLKDEGLAHCPDCDVALQNEYRNETPYLYKGDFGKSPKKSNLKCFCCGAMLWQNYVKKTNKCSLVRFLRAKNIRFDSIIIDEAHEGNNSKSIVGIAQRNVCKQADKIIFLSATTNNGYASNLHNILMTVESRKLQDDDCIKQSNFVKKYGTMVGSNSELDTVYRNSGKTDMRESDFKEVEGINSICVSKYLMENYVSATLEDLGDLPEFNETLVDLQAPNKLVSAARSLDKDIKSANRFIWKSYQNTITRRYINYPDKWSPVPIGEESVTPTNLDIASPKQQWIVDKCLEEVSDGRKVGVYTEFTGDGSMYQDGNVARKYYNALEKAGLKVFWLKSSSVSAIDRRDFITKKAEDYDVFVLSPFLVRVGVNLQSIPTYIFGDIGYRVNIYEQAKMRGYRADSTQDNRVFYLYYGNTIEAEIMERYKLKLGESKAVECRLSLNVEGQRTSSSLSKKIHTALTGLS